MQLYARLLHVREGMKNGNRCEIHGKIKLLKNNNKKKLKKHFTNSNECDNI